MRVSTRSGRVGRSRFAQHILRRAAAIEMLESRTLLSAAGHAKSAGAVPHGVPIAVPTLSTLTNTNELTLGLDAPELSDTADLENGGSPTGSIKFTVTGPQFVGSDTETVNGNGMYFSDSYDLPTVGTVAGKYSWAVQYSGDQNNASVSDNEETVDVDRASPELNTTPASSSVTLSGSTPALQDSATLLDAYFPTGTITFTLHDPNNTVIDTETVPVDGDSTYSTSIGGMPTVAGTYQWDATYSGDANNNPANDNNDSSDQVTVSKASPTLTTFPEPTTDLLGPISFPINDSADLSGGYKETGSITFTLYNSTNTQVFSQTVTVFGDGTYSAGIGYMPTSAGIYQWDASYSGDNANNSVSDNNNTNEQVTVTAATPFLFTTPNPITTELNPGSTTLNDSADLTEGANPTGTITFTLYNPSDILVDTETVSVSGNGAYSTPTGYSVPVGATGTYEWDASYSGDSGNIPATETDEQVTVFAAPDTSSISGTVYTDPTGDGFSNDDIPLSGFKIDLFENGGSTPVDTTITAADGTYSFGGLLNGTYRVQEELPAGYTQTAGNSGYTHTFSNTGDTVTGDNFDNFQNLSISGTVYKDKTGDGLTADDTPFSGVTIDLYLNGGSTPVQTTTTAANGSYSFTNLGPGTWGIQQVVPAGYTPTYGAGGYNLTVGSGGNTPGINFDDYLSATTSTISGTAYTDITGGGFSNDDTPLSGVTIDLFENGGSTPVSTTTTAADGTYSFGGLADGTYTVQEEVPADYTQTGGNAGYTETFTSGGNNATGDNFDNFQNISISGFKYKDLTDNGFSQDDTPLGGVTIQLSHFLDPPLETTTTAADGSYSFSDLGPAVYVVTEIVPPGYTETGGFSYIITAVSGQNSTGNNFDNYLLPTSTITGTKYQDITGNGITSDDTALSGVTIDLYENGGTTPIATTTTAANGTYSFTGLGAGTYKVKEVVPSGWTQTVGSSGYTVVVTGGSNTYSGKNFADFKNISISGTKFKDITGNGFSSDDTHLGGVKIELFKNSGSSSAYRTTITASNGTYSFTNLGPGSYKVEEVVPSGYIQTGGGPSGSAGKTYYSVSAHSGKNSSGDNFDDYQIPTCKPKNVYFTINHGSTKYTTLSGHTKKGETVTVTFTVPAGMDDVLTLVSYTSVSASFSNSTASQQKIYQVATGTFAPGTHSLTITIPNRDYQIDFVCGPALTQLLPPSAGPDSKNIIYSAEDRLLSTDT